MIVGFDIDNTIVDCRETFATIAGSYLGRDLSALSRAEIRSLVRNLVGDSVWTEIQSEVYGPSYHRCKPFDDCVDVLRDISQFEHVDKVVLVSHKTRHDSAGRGIPLRDFAKKWVEEKLVGTCGIDLDRVYFCDSIESKAETIGSLKCDFFLDDLFHVLDNIRDFVTYPCLFDGETEGASSGDLQSDYLSVSSWSSVRQLIQSYAA